MLRLNLFRSFIFLHSTPLHTIPTPNGFPLANHLSVAASFDRPLHPPPQVVRSIVPARHTSPAHSPAAATGQTFRAVLLTDWITQTRRFSSVQAPPKHPHAPAAYGQPARGPTPYSSSYNKRQTVYNIQNHKKYVHFFPLPPHHLPFDYGFWPAIIAPVLCGLHPAASSSCTIPASVHTNAAHPPQNALPIVPAAVVKVARPY